MTSYKKGIFQAAALAGATLLGVQMASAADLVTTPDTHSNASVSTKFKYACDNKKPTTYIAIQSKFSTKQWNKLLDDVVAGKYEIIGKTYNAKHEVTGLKLVKPLQAGDCKVQEHGSKGEKSAPTKGAPAGNNGGAQTGGGQTGEGQTGGGQTGGGQTGGGQTGGGQTGGGQTGGNTGGNDCGDGGQKGGDKGQHGDKGGDKGQHGDKGGDKGHNNGDKGGDHNGDKGGDHGRGGDNGHNGGDHGHGGGRHAMLEQGISGTAVATLVPVTTFKFG